ncbi:MAG: LOG family protein [Bacteroidales bacterium]|nr:LOG family protein [Bacteroidales bacterium]
MDGKAAVFFCSAVSEIDPKYNQAARACVRAACLSGYGIVSGGTVKGCMKVVADTAAALGAPNRGVLPRFMRGLEHPSLTETLWTDTMSQRKELMRCGTCLAVALPGGIGTLDELSETLCLAKMGLYRGRVVALNLDGFYDAYRAQLDRFVQEGMLSGQARALIDFPETVEAFEKLL